MPTLRGVAFAAFLVAPALASAQDEDLEYRAPDLETQDKKLEVHASFESQWHEYNNLDHRELDESSDQAILDSDDRDAFAFTGISADLGYQIDGKTRFVMGVSHRGLWGNDQLGTTSAFGGWVYFTSLFAEFKTAESDEAITFRIGRQFYDIGGLPAPDFVFADIVDMVRVDLPLGSVGSLQLVPINVAGLAGGNDHANFYGYIGQGAVQTYGFRGDHMTRRHGLTLVLDGIADPLDIRAYAFYTDIGSLGSGSDISYNGVLGNFSDNDAVANFGARGSFEAGPITPYLSVDLSSGIDRKELVAEDVDTFGVAIHGGLDLYAGDREEGTGFFGHAYFYQSMGPAYNQRGMQYSHGYVGMKGQQVGGTFANRFLGWHPSAYVGMFGVSDTPHELDRKSGTRVIHAKLGYDLPKVLSVGARYWFLQDTGVTYLDLTDVDTIDAPYGYARDEFRAEGRLGKVLGHEIDLDIGLQLSDPVKFTLNGAIFLPGSFYEQEVARVAGTALGGDTMGWAANGGMRVDF